MATNFPAYIIVHTAASGSNGTDFDVDAETIDRWHRENGWAGIGYHYVIRKDGSVERGRAETARGAHCTHMAMNTKSIGICMSGHHNYARWTPEQWDAFLALAADIMERHKIDSGNILGHKETGAPRDCPGKLVDMHEVRRRAREAVLAVPAAPEETMADTPFVDHPEVPEAMAVRVLYGGRMWEGEAITK